VLLQSPSSVHRPRAPAVANSANTFRLSQRIYNSVFAGRSGLVTLRFSGPDGELMAITVRPSQL
jgi:hypothetical protein